jgi:ribonuclease VapC
MVIDTSAVLAILFDEPERRRFTEAIEAADTRLVSTATVLEAAHVVESKRGEAGGRELDLFLHRAAFQRVPFNDEQLDIARGAMRRYGKGRHRAALNYGDCFAYALAVATGEPLLFKGRDFALTDVPQA